MSYKLTILGSSSALPTVEKNPTAQLLNANERFFLIDCAEGTQVQLRKYKIKFQKITRIFISHLHGDHYFGLIGIINTMHLLGRKKDLHVYAHSKLKSIIDIQLQASSTELCYPLFFHPINPDIDEVLFEDNKIKVSTFPLNHGIDCNGFLFEEKLPPRKLLSEKVQEYNIPIEKLKEIKLGADFISKDGQKISNTDITKENRTPNSYAFCSDTKYHPELIEKIKNVKLLYHETTFLKDMSSRADETNHSTTIDAANIAKLSKVKTLLIGHFSQRYQNKDLLLIEVKSIFDNAITAYEGLTINFSDL